MVKELVKTNNGILGYTPDEARNTAIEAIRVVRQIIESRPDKLVIKGKQYIELQDWELIGIYFGVFARVESTERIYKDRPTGNFMLKEDWGVKTVCSTYDRAGNKLATAIMECTKDEPQFASKPMNQISAMAQTRGCRRAFILTLKWVFDISGTHDFEVEEEPADAVIDGDEMIPPHVPQSEQELLNWVCEVKGFNSTKTARSWLVNEQHYAPEKIVKDAAGIYGELVR